MFRTKRFGVNNQWWSNFDSMWGWGHKKRIWNIVRIRPMIENYRHMKLRAGTMCHFLTDKDYEDCFGKKKNE